ncbi:MAG TPA: HAD-IIIA family hydrolase, partial [Symbiobacteriaceae bacterium]|nr:HAD-IIIA family hydrolase [Symbiobacteriaceae bacterium]
MNLQAVFIDRDGTIGGTGRFIHPRDFQPFDGASKAFARLRAAGLKVFAFTNQTHIGLGDVTEAEFRAEFASYGFDGAYICPHEAGVACTCRKPSTEMLERAAAEHGLDLSRCAVIGDVGANDMVAAHGAGCLKVLVRTGWGETSLGEFRHTWAGVEPDYVAADLAGAADWLLSGRRYKAFVFDLFGTLIDNMPRAPHMQLLASALEVPVAEFEPAWMATGNRRFTGGYASVAECFTEVGRLLGREFSPAVLSRAAAVRLAEMRAAMAPRPDAVATLSTLRCRGLKIGMVTNCTLETDVLWAETELAPLVDAPLFSSREGRVKPDPELYREVCRRLGVLPRDCVYVGDGGSRELETAAEVGMDPVLIAVPYEEARRAARQAAWQG